MSQGLLVDKKDFEALKRTLAQNQSMLSASQTENKKLRKKTALYVNQYNVVVSELNAKIQRLSREKMLAEGTKNIIEKEKKIAQLEMANQLKNLIVQKIFICR